MDTDAAVTIKVDQGRCSGHGRCANAAPQIYDLDEDGYCAVTQLVLGLEQQAVAKLGAEPWPSRSPRR
jgi:ferredoxin